MSTELAPSAVSPVTPSAAPAARLASVDAYRGFVMLLMMAEILRLSRVAEALPGNGFWHFLSSQQTHVEWEAVKCSLHDLIQPSFSFLVGVALPFSIASRVRRGQSTLAMTGHAAWRALLLIVLGLFLRAMHSMTTNWTFEDTLTQIGLGYPFLFLLGLRPTREQWVAFGLIVVGYWAAFALYPLPGAGFDYGAVGVTREWLSTYGQTGFAAHWQKNSNLAAAFDTWWLNLFGRQDPFLFNRGGYATLSFVPTLATMILGLVAGQVLRSARSPQARIRWFLVAGVIGLAAGAALGASGIAPVVKRIWTPSWVVYSGGWCFLLLAAFYWLVDVRQSKGWVFPLVVIGTNSIAAYMMAQLFENFSQKALERHFGAGLWQIFGLVYEPLVLGAVALATMWLILWWMYWRKLFVKI